MHEDDGSEQVLIQLARIELSSRITRATEVVGQHQKAACSKPGCGIAPLILRAPPLVRTDDDCRHAVPIKHPSELNVVLGGKMDRGTGYVGRRWCWRDRWRWGDHRCWRGCCLLWSWFGTTGSEHKEHREEREYHSCYSQPVSSHLFSSLND